MKNYEIRICNHRLPIEFRPLQMFAIASDDPHFQFGVICLMAAHFVYDLDKNEYVEPIDEGAEWVLEYITRIGTDAFGKEYLEKQKAQLKTNGIHVYIMNGRNIDPRNN